MAFSNTAAAVVDLLLLHQERQDHSARGYTLMDGSLFDPKPSMLERRIQFPILVSNFQHHENFRFSGV